jgi:hypothetical protein
MRFRRHGMVDAHRRIGALREGRPCHQRWRRQREARAAQKYPSVDPDHPYLLLSCPLHPRRREYPRVEIDAADARERPFTKT